MMLDYVRGRLKHKQRNRIVVEVFNNSLGINVKVPDNWVAELNVGDTVCVYLYMMVRESGIELYGFKDVRQREVFEDIISVPNVGPETAIRILAELNVEEFTHIVGSGNERMLASIRGVGPKKAERIIFHLRDKYKVPERREDWDTAVGVLTNLGFERQKVWKVLQEIDWKDKDLEAVIKEALAKL